MFAAVSLLVSSKPVHADEARDAEAVKHYEQGKAYFRVREFDLCAKEFAASQALRPKAGALFNQARCNEESGNLEEAIELFSQYIQTASEGTFVTEARARSAALKTRLEEVSKPPLPVKEATPIPLKGKLTVTAPAGSQIFIDSKEVGNGRFEGELKAGGHTLRVLAKGMRPYQSEISIAGGEPRAIDVLLEEDVGASTRVTAKRAETDTFELGASTASGIKLRGDRPMVVIIRAEAALRVGKRVNLGLFVEHGAIDTSGSCGFSMPGPTPATPFDFGERFQFNDCSYLLGGAQLYVHLLPKGRIDPYLGVAPGFRAGFTKWTPHLAGEPQKQESEFFPAIVVGLRAGLNYHPLPQLPAWQVGAYFESAITALGQEASEEFDRADEAEYVFMTVLAGIRSTMVF